MSAGKPRGGIGAAPRAFMGLQAHAAEFDSEPHQAARRGLAIATMLLVLIAAPLVWSSSAFADDDQLKAITTSHSSGNSGPGGGDDDGDGDGGDGDDDDGPTATSANGGNTAGTTNDSGASNDTNGRSATGTATSHDGGNTVGTTN